MNLTMQRFTLLSCSLLSAILSVSAIAGESVSSFSANSGNISAVLTLETSPLVTMRPTPFTLSVVDESAKPITGLDFICALTMPAMPMPPNRPDIEQDDTFYRGTMTFTMAGAWQATCRATGTDGQTFDLVFDIPTVLMK